MNGDTAGFSVKNPVAPHRATTLLKSLFLMFKNFFIKKLKVIQRTLLYYERYYQGLSSLRKLAKTDFWLTSSDIFRFPGIWVTWRIFIFVKNLQISNPQNDTFWIAPSVSEYPAKTASQNFYSFQKNCGLYSTVLTFRWAISGVVRFTVPAR